MGKFAKGSGIAAIRQRVEHQKKHHEKYSAYGGQPANAVDNFHLDETGERREEEELKKLNKRDKDLLVREDLEMDRDGKKTQRVGKPNKPYLGTRITKPKCYRESTKDILDYILDVGNSRHGLYMPVFDTYNGRQWVAMTNEMYFKHNIAFMTYSGWYLSSAYFLKLYVLPNFDSFITNKSRKTYLLGLRHHLSEINSIFGPAFVPNNYSEVNGKRVYVLHIPIKQLKKAQAGFVSRYGAVNHPGFAMFGKAFSSDITGDGPTFSYSAVIAHYLNSVPLDFAQACYEMWANDPMVFHLDSIIVWILSRDHLWNEDELFDIEEPTIPMCNVILRMHKIHNIFKKETIKEKFSYRIEFSYLSNVFETVPAVASQLNGNNGEWTGSDDVVDECQMWADLYLMQKKDARIASIELALGHAVKFIEFAFEQRVSWARMNEEHTKSFKFDKNILRLRKIKNDHDLTQHALEMHKLKVRYEQKLKNVAAVSLNIKNSIKTLRQYCYELMDLDCPDRELIHSNLLLADKFETRLIGVVGGMINNKVKNSGTGGKSKCNSAPKSSLSDSEIADLRARTKHLSEPDNKNLGTNLSNFFSSDDSSEEGESEEKGGEPGDKGGGGGGGPKSPPPNTPGSLPKPAKSLNYKKKLEAKDVKISSFPTAKKQFSTDEVTPYLFLQIKPYDMLGSPCCGYVCIKASGDEALEPPDFDYIYSRLDLVNKKDINKSYPPEYAVGTDAELSAFAQRKQLNLIIITKPNKNNIGFKDPLCPGWNLISNICYDATFKTAILVYDGDSEYGHYKLGICDKSLLSKYELPEITTKSKYFWFFEFGESVKNISKFSSSSAYNYDGRAPNCSREKIEHADSFTTVEHSEFVKLNWDNIDKVVDTTIAIVSIFVPYKWSIGSLLVYGAFRLADREDKIIYRTTKFTVSTTLFHMVYPSIQLKPVDDLKILSMLNVKTVNTDANVPLILTNTANYARITSRIIHTGLVTMIDDGGKQYCEPNRHTYIGDNVMESYAACQAAAKILYGGGKKNRNHRNFPNHVVKINKARSEPKVGIVMANAPIGCFYNNGIPVSPGMLPVTDQDGIIAAFVGRSMSKIPNEVNETVNKFCKFFRTYFQTFIDELDLSDLVEEEPLEFFKQHYKGKRSQAWISSMVSSYESYLDQGQPDSYDENSCFVKLENSAKQYEGFIAPKPRLIMVMSPVLLINYCQFLKIIDVWNEGRVKQFQIKHEPMETIIEKIVNIQDRPHVVTDYSSFECSIMGKIRDCENWLIYRLLTKANFLQTRAVFRKRVVRGRYLKSNGVTMYINSRNSGDFHTSFGNGVINLAIAQFQSFEKTGKECLMIMEGDDANTEKGVMDVDTTTKLGFSFSEDVSGNYPGDTDFLQKRWIDGKLYLNIGKMMSTMWVKDKATLSRNKQMFILRCMGSSLHYLSPGHPILCSIVNRIGKMTASYRKPFKNWFLHIDLYAHQFVNVDNYPKHVVPDETMRSAIHHGATGFPPIPYDIQLALESMIETSKIVDFQDTLSHYPQIRVYLASSNADNHRDFGTHPSFKRLLDDLSENSLEEVAFRIGTKVENVD